MFASEGVMSATSCQRRFTIALYSSFRSIRMSPRHYTSPRRRQRQHQAPAIESPYRVLTALRPKVILSAPARCHRDRGRAVEGQQEDGMEQRLALSALAALTLTALFGSPALPATGDAAKPGTIVTVAG